MAEYNPNTTATKGLEWLPPLAGSVTLDALTKSASMSMLQTTSQAIGTARVYLGALPTRGGLYGLEVFDNETAVVGAATTLTAQPNEDVSGTGATAWQEDDGTTTTIYSEIDETTLDLTDYIKWTAGSAGTTQYAGRFNTGGLTLTALRIVALRVVMIYAGDVPTYGGGWQFRAGVSLGGVDYYNGSTAFYYPPVHDSDVFATQYTRSFTMYLNPSTGRPWTIAEVQAFDTTDEFFCTSGQPTTTSIRVYQAYLEVVTVPENRLAVGVLDDRAAALTADSWNAVTLLTPTGGTWTKDATGRHLYVLRRLSSTGAVVVPTLDSGTAPNPAQSFDPTLDPTYGYATAMGSALSPVFGLIQRTTAPAESVDSQPYALIAEGKVYNGQAAQQEFSNAAAVIYKTIRALVKPNGGVGDLLVKLKRRSDDVQFGSTLTLTSSAAAALADAGNGWKLFTLTMASGGTLAAATQYYVEFSDATAADDGTGSGDTGKFWSILTLDTADQGNGAGFGGTTDRATINGAEADRYDIPSTVASIPNAPTGFSASIQEQIII